jgi:hypothetical protein
MHERASVGRYAAWYRSLLRLAPGAFRERFGESMEQTFIDLCEEQLRRHRSRSDLVFLVRLFGDTALAITKEHAVQTTRNNKPVLAVIAATLAVLSVPLVFTLMNPNAELRGGAGLSTSGVNWTLSDFVIMGGLLLVTGLAVVLASRMFRARLARLLAVLVVLAGFLAVWAELAVGAVSQVLAQLPF